MYRHLDVQDKDVIQVQGKSTLFFLSWLLSATGTDYRPI